MKNKKVLIIFSLMLSMLLSGCNSEENTELDELINGLQTVYINEGSEQPDSTEDNTSFSSITGIVVSASAKSLTVKSDNAEYEIIIDDSTKILGGSINDSEYVTVTYENTEDSKEKITAKIITVLSDDSSISEEDNSVDTEPTSEEQTIPSPSETESETETDEYLSAIESSEPEEISEASSETSTSSEETLTETTIEL